MLNDSFGSLVDYLFFDFFLYAGNFLHVLFSVQYKRVEIWFIQDYSFVVGDPFFWVKLVFDQFVADIDQIFQAYGPKKCINAYKQMYCTENLARAPCALSLFLFFSVIRVVLLFCYEGKCDVEVSHAPLWPIYFRAYRALCRAHLIKILARHSSFVSRLVPYCAMIYFF